MKKIKTIIVSFVAIATFSCTDGFQEFNTNPETELTVDPMHLLYTAETSMLTSGHAWNSIFATKYRWLQYGVGVWNYGTTQYTYLKNEIGNVLYDDYNNMGANVTHIRYLIDNDENPDQYYGVKDVARILLISKGMQTSDMFGSLAYSQAWLARAGKIDDESMTPGFETQEELVTVWNNQLKECIENLKKSETSQVKLKGHDRAYNGDLTKWIKAANGMRLRLASRILKRNETLAKEIISEVLAPDNAPYVFSSNDDSYILWFDKLYTNIHDGDWHSIKDMEVASYATMNYLNRNEDPRKRMYFAINNLTADNISRFNAQQDNADRLIPTDYTRWEGSSASYDSWDIKIDRRRHRFYLTEKDKSQTDMRPANTPHARLWKGNDNDGNGGNWAPVMTYADFCFLAAEFTLRYQIPSIKTTQQWYDEGVLASLNQWNEIGKYCDIPNYSAMTEVEIATFLAKPDIKWDPNKALEQIYCQSYIEHYKNVDEAYILHRRVNVPNTNSSIITFEPIFINKKPQEIPRRVRLSYPNKGVHNYENLMKRLDVMKQDPEFGEVQNEFGRVWWDKK